MFSGGLPVWIGLTDIEEENKFVWNSGRPLSDTFQIFSQNWKNFPSLICFTAFFIIFIGDMLFGPSDVGGSCPTGAYQLGNLCCCVDGCCWNRCLPQVIEKAPENCLPSGAEWMHYKYNGALQHYTAVTTGAQLFGILR